MFKQFQPPRDKAKDLYYDKIPEIHDRNTSIFDLLSLKNMRNMLKHNHIFVYDRRKSLRSPCARIRKCGVRHVELHEL